MVDVIGLDGGGVSASGDEPGGLGEEVEGNRVELGEVFFEDEQVGAALEARAFAELGQDDFEDAGDGKRGLSDEQGQEAFWLQRGHPTFEHGAFAFGRSERRPAGEVHHPQVIGSRGLKGFLRAAFQTSGLQRAPVVSPAGQKTLHRTERGQLPSMLIPMAIEQGKRCVGAFGHRIQ